jgi:hypothetical protein
LRVTVSRHDLDQNSLSRGCLSFIPNAVYDVNTEKRARMIRAPRYHFHNDCSFQKIYCRMSSVISRAIRIPPRTSLATRPKIIFCNTIADPPCRMQLPFRFAFVNRQRNFP